MSTRRFLRHILHRFLLRITPRLLFILPLLIVALGGGLTLAQQPSPTATSVPTYEKPGQGIEAWVTDVTTNSISLDWTPRPRQYGLDVGYEVRYQPKGTGDNYQYIYVLETEATLTGLQANTDYEIGIRNYLIVNKQHDAKHFPTGITRRELIVRTNGSTPTPIAEVEPLTFLNIVQRHPSWGFHHLVYLTITWDGPTHTGHYSFTFDADDIEYIALGNNGKLPYTLRPLYATSITPGQLIPSARYKFTVNWHPGPDSPHPKKSISAYFEPASQKTTILPTSTPKPTATATPYGTPAPTSTPTHHPLLPPGWLEMIFPEISHDSITLQWTDLGERALLYTININSSGFADFIRKFPDSKPKTSHEFSGLKADTVYDFRITAFYGPNDRRIATGQARTLPEPTATNTSVGRPQRAAVDTATPTPTATPTNTLTPTSTATPIATSTPTNTATPKPVLPGMEVWVSAATSNSITLDWTPLRGVHGYRIYKGFGPHNYYETTDTQFTWTNLDPDWLYTFFVAGYINSKDGKVFGWPERRIDTSTNSNGEVPTPIPEVEPLTYLTAEELSRTSQVFADIKLDWDGPSHTGSYSVKVKPTGLADPGFARKYPKTLSGYFDTEYITGNVHLADSYEFTVTWHPGPNSPHPKKSKTIRFDTPAPTNTPTATATNTSVGRPQRAAVDTATPTPTATSTSTPTATPIPTATPVLGNTLSSYPDNYKIRISNITWGSVTLNGSFSATISKTLMRTCSYKSAT